MKRLIIIDVSNFIFRAFFAIRPLHAPDGTPVNAVYGVLSMLYNLISKHEPTHVLIARDTKEPSFREKLYTEYKANRSEPPDELVPQFPLVEELFTHLNLPHCAMIGYEADDIIGSVATQYKNDFDEILIASGDKDLMQFVDGPVKILDTMKDKTYLRDEVFEKMGVYPEQIVDYLSLVGDSSDNIPGVPGIGAKGASNLLAEFNNLENILKNIEKIKNKKTLTALKENTDKALLSKELVKIVCDLNLPFHQKDLEYSLKLSPGLKEFLERLGFRSWLTKLTPLIHHADQPAEKIKESSGTSSDELSWKEFDDFISPQAKGEKVIVSFLLEDEMDQFSECKLFAVRSGTTTRIYKNSRTYCSKLLNELSEAAAIITDHGKFYHQLCLRENISASLVIDVVQAHFVVNPEKRHDLSTIYEELTGKVFLFQEEQGDLLQMDQGSHKALAERVVGMSTIWPKLEKKLKEQKVDKPFYDLDIPMLKVLGRMELLGISIDTDYFKGLENQFSKILLGIEDEIQKLTGMNVNLRSPKQVGELLFEKLQLPVIRKTKTGYSTDAEVLTELSLMKIHPIPDLILKYRELEKLQSTYVKVLPTLVNPQTHRLHTHFQLSNAATGRLSSDNPNLQNIPVRTENGKLLRKGFVPKKDHQLLSADYSQVELRILAHFSEDPQMLFAFAHNKDIHIQTAAEIFDVPIEQVTKEMRNSAKAINFGLMYGQGSFGLSQSLRISQAEAKKYITNYFTKFHKVKSYLDGLKEFCESSGYAETLFGRKRYLPDIKSTNRQIKAMAERIAINSPIQGTAADIIKLAMIRIDQRILNEGLTSKMILQVHDELIFEVPQDEIPQMEELVRQEMENVVPLKVPLKVDMSTGLNWYEL